MAKAKKNDSNVKARNRKAYHEFNVLEVYQAGIVLTGTEIKSVRESKISLADSYAKVDKGEIWLINAHISPYEQGNRYNHQIDRLRKLLLTRSEIRKIENKMKQSSLTIVPLKVYVTRGWAKVEIGLAQGKKLYDKKHDLAKKDMKRDMERALKSGY